MALLALPGKRLSTCSEHGQALVEFSLLVPFIMMMLIGLTDVSRAVFYYNVISSAAREGAREAILNYNQCSNTEPPWTCAAGQPPLTATLVGVENGIRRAGAGVLGYQFAEASGDTNKAPDCTPQPNRGCVWIFIVNPLVSGSCIPPTNSPADSSYTTKYCNFNPIKPTASALGNNGDVVVEVEYQFQALTPLLQSVMGGSSGFHLWAKSEMRAEY